MQSIIWLQCLFTASLADPSSLEYYIQQVLQTLQDISHTLQQKSNTDEIIALNDWKAFKEKHKKNYEDKETEQKRRQIFRNNRKKIAAHNEMYRKGLASYWMRMNKFSDMDEDELVNTMTGHIESADEDIPVSAKRNNTNINLPPQIDWRTRGAVTPVKNQSNCGACWAFAATGALESRIFLKNKTLVSLSEQNLIDCSVKIGNHGCNGGNAVKAFSYIKEYGIDTESSYPYEAKQGKCRHNVSKRGASDIGFVSLSGGEDHLMEVVATDGPVAVSIDTRPLHFYSGGVLYSDVCVTPTPNHAVLVIGYGTDTIGGDYWLIKNSWGTNWGMNGYFKLARNRQNHCGVATRPVYPIA